MKKKLFILFAIIVLLFLLRYPILKGAGNYLNVATTPPDKIETLFVLSGGGFDRGAEAARIYQTSVIDKIICTGENFSPDLLVFQNDSIVESVLTKMRITQLGVPDSLVEIIVEGTSTIEESEVILNYCLKNNLKEISVLSSNFHTRRIKYAFKKKFKKKGIQLTILGAPSSFFDESKWWTDENGLIGVNNEYIKLLVYRLKY